jgi:hypothetical protein
MANRTPTSDDPTAAALDAYDPNDEDEDTAEEVAPAWTAPQPGSYERRGPDTQHRHDGGRDEFHHQGNLPHYHDPDSGILVFFDLAVPAPNGAATTADPTPAGVPDPGEGSEPSAPFGDPGAGSDTAGSGRPPRARGPDGRFVGNSRPAVPVSLPVSVALEHALIDADAATYLATVHAKLRMARVVLDAIRFGVEADRLETALAVKAGMLVRLGSDGGQP